jgi:Outer membrane protein beta-barrel domain
MKNHVLLVICSCLLLIGLREEASAQTQPVELGFSIGKGAFLDEDIPFDHLDFGASMRFYLTRRLGIQPEFVYMKGPGSDRDYLVVPNIVYNLLDSGRNQIYVIGGAGLIHHTEKFPGSIDPDFSDNEWTASGGIGAKIHLNEHFFVSGDFRFGWEPLLRISGGIGYRFR